MKVILIAPASGRWRKVGKRRIFNGRTFRFSMLSILSVAAATPEDVEIELIDEQVDTVPDTLDADLVGITCMTALAPRAYELAARIRAQGIPVVLGGMHPTLCAEEAVEHADAIVVGDAEDAWPKVIDDVRNGTLKKIYQGEFRRCLDHIKRPPRQLLKAHRYAAAPAVQATRGCPHGCEFCSIAAFNNNTQRYRPIADVLDDVKHIRQRFFIFVDDNLMADREYAAALFKALIPLKKLWITQSTLSVANDPELIKLASKAGCRGIFAGVETFSQSNLNAAEKSFNKVAEYKKAIRRLHRNGIAVEAGIVLGFDHDTPIVFQDALKQMDDMKIDVAQISIFTPLPGTPGARRMQSRITDHDWSHYDFHHVVFAPAGMSTSELKAGHDWITREFYRPWRIARRCWRHLLRPHGLQTMLYFAAINLAYYGRIVSWKIKGWNPAMWKTQAKEVCHESLSPIPAR